MLQSHYKKKLCLYFCVLATLPSIIFPTEGQRKFGIRRLFPILNLLDFVITLFLSSLCQYLNNVLSPLFLDVLFLKISLDFPLSNFTMKVAFSLHDN